MGYINRSSRGRRGWLGCPRRLGDDVIVATDPAIAGQYPVSPIGLDPGFTAPFPSDLTEPSPLPSVSASTLLAAANLPGAPTIVRQAAAQYQAANPFGSFLSGSVGGIPMSWLLGGVGLLILVPLLSGGKRRR